MVINTCPLVSIGGFFQKLADARCGIEIKDFMERVSCQIDFDALE